MILNVCTCNMSWVNIYLTPHQHTWTCIYSNIYTYLKILKIGTNYLFLSSNHSYLVSNDSYISYNTAINTSFLIILSIFQYGCHGNIHYFIVDSDELNVGINEFKTIFQLFVDMFIFCNSV